MKCSETKRKKERKKQKEIKHNNFCSILSDSTFTWSDKALNPKSEILRFPATSSNRFSSCIREISTFKFHTISLIITDDTNKEQNQGWTILHLQVSVVYTPTVAIVYSIDQLLKVSTCFLLLQSSTCGLIVNLDSESQTVM